MSILCIGDIHIKPTNVHLVDLLEQQIINYIHERKIDIVVLLGDILDTFEKLHTQALNRAYRLIDALRQHTKVYILVGNHDYINNQQFLTSEHWMNALKDWKNVIIVDQVYRYQDLVFVPYVPVRRFVEALEHLDYDWKTARYIFAHQEFKGCKMGAIVSSEGDEWQEDWPMIISGHIHDRQQPQQNIYYIGASIQNSFGDQTTPMLLWLQQGSLKREELPLELPRKKTVYTDIQQIKDLSIDQILDKKNIEMVRVVVKCEYEEFKVFSQSKQYEELQSNQKCKIVHKLPEPKPKDEPQINDSSEITHSSTNFDQILFQKVLHTKNEFIYCAYNEVVHDTILEPEDFIIV